MRAVPSSVAVPEALAASHARYFGAAGERWLSELPLLAGQLLDRWGLTPAGRPRCGAVALVLPVVDATGAPAVLKLQPVDDETVGEPVALWAWQGRGAVRLLRHDPPSGTLLLERLDADRSLDGVRDDQAALQVVGELLAGLNAVAAPPGLRRLADVAAGMLARVPVALARTGDPDLAGVVRACAARVGELLPEAGDRLLHWDLHYQNVLARPAQVGGEPIGGEPGGWVAIDPKPLAGDPGFELLAALHNRWGEVTATGDVRRAVLRRFDLLTEVTGLDRSRAAGWTLGRVLQTLLWQLESGSAGWPGDADVAVARALLDGRDAG